jgi:hypothetical protein
MATKLTVKQLLSQLVAGDITIEEVEADFRQRDWPSAGKLPDSEADPLTRVEGSFAEVHGAFMSQKIDAETYGRLANAASGLPSTSPEPDARRG